MGTGNGALLVGLARRGFKRLTGSDYSAASVDLAAAVLDKHELGGSARLMVSIMRHSLYSDGRVAILLAVGKGHDKRGTRQQQTGYLRIHT